MAAFYAAASTLVHGEAALDSVPRGSGTKIHILIAHDESFVMFGRILRLVEFFQFVQFAAAIGSEDFPPPGAGQVVASEQEGEQLQTGVVTIRHSPVDDRVAGPTVSG